MATLRRRLEIAEMFSTFVHFKNDTDTKWNTNNKLRQSIESSLKELSSKSEQFWSLYWYRIWLNNADALAFKHLFAYLQEPCYWAALKTMKKLSRIEYELSDLFQMGIAEVEKVCNGFNPERSSNIKTYANVAFPSLLKDILRQRRDADICTDAYINRVCLNTLLDFIQYDGLQASICLGADNMFSVWDIVNGSAISIGTTKLVIVPTEAIYDELEVPQEWVDIPSWLGDYYIAVQFRLEDNCLRVWGYTTHQELKNNVNYDSRNRVYRLDASKLTCDMDTLWVRRKCYPQALTRALVSPLPELSATVAENLIARLADAAVVFPRLSVPFVTWGALLENENWRHQLYTTRQRIQGNTTVPHITRLGEWLQGRFDNTWQTIEDTLSNQQGATAWRSQNTQNLTAQNQNPIFTTKRVKILDFGSSSYERIALVVGILPIDENEITIGIEVLPTDNAYLSNYIQVRLLDEDDNEIARANANVTQTIKFQFRGQRSEKFNIEVTSNSEVMTEYFVI
jgi:RNA polymerase sigma factor (sigma-70 family)